MSSSDRSPADDGATATPPARTSWWLALGCFLVLLLPAIGGLVAWRVVRPYDRASDELRLTIERLAPPGTRVEAVAVRFPADVSIGRAELPGNPQLGVPALTLRDLSGTTTVRSWLRGQPEFRLATGIWNGTVRLHAAFTDRLSSDARAVPSLALTGEVDGVRLEECMSWLQVPGDWMGAVRATATGRFEPQYPSASAVNVVFQGEELHIPELDFGDVVLPPNRRAAVSGTATYRDDTIEIESLSVSGTGYALDANARVIVQRPMKQSPLRGRVAIQLREMATVRRSDVDEETARGMMRLLIQSRGQLHAKLRGTVGAPEAILDEANTVRSLLQGGR